MHYVVTAGPTWEPWDQVRRLTNFSTGRMGTELARYLAAAGHQVLLLRGEAAVYGGEAGTARLETFSTAEDLAGRLRALRGGPVDALFHAAAVSDYAFGRTWERQPDGVLREVSAGKFSSRAGALLVELRPTPKIIASLRDWFPRACLVGWKYEVEGGRARALERGRRQVRESGTTACVVNGPAYGEGFGLIGPGKEDEHLPDVTSLYAALRALV